MAENEQDIGKVQAQDTSIYQGAGFEAEISETATTFTAVVRSNVETVIFQYSPPGDVSFKIVSATTPLPDSSAEIVTDNRPQQPIPETPLALAAETQKTVKLFGRTATEVYRAIAPSGEPMTIVSFAEHPSWHTESQSNTEPEKVKEDTRYWQAAAFGTYAQVLHDLPKGKASILIGYPKTMKKVGKGGQEETIKNGFQVVERKPFLATPKPKKP